jgi:hypothetical protein
MPPNPNPYANQYAASPVPWYPNQYEPQGVPEGYGEEQDPPYSLLDVEQTLTGGTTGPTTPVDTTTAEPVVQTPQETSSNADSTASASPPTPTTNSNMDPLDIQLAAAEEAVKADMISKGKEVLEEKQWTDDVKAVIEQYTKKNYKCLCQY